MMIYIIVLSFSLFAAAEPLIFKDKQITLSLIKNHNLIEGKIKGSGTAEINQSPSEIKNLKIKLQSRTLQFKDKKDSDLLKSKDFFSANKYEIMQFTGAKLKHSGVDGNSQIFAGQLEVKIKDKVEMVKIQARFKKTKDECELDFPLEIKDRTNPLGLKFNSKKYSSEVELGENLIDDKLSFSFSLKCN